MDGLNLTPHLLYWLWDCSLCFPLIISDLLSEVFTRSTEPNKRKQNPSLFLVVFYSLFVSGLNIFVAFKVSKKRYVSEDSLAERAEWNFEVMRILMKTCMSSGALDQGDFFKHSLSQALVTVPRSFISLTQWKKKCRRLVLINVSSLLSLLSPHTSLNTSWYCMFSHSHAVWFFFFLFQQISRLAVSGYIYDWRTCLDICVVCVCLGRLYQTKRCLMCFISLIRWAEREREREILNHHHYIEL